MTGLADMETALVECYWTPGQLMKLPAKAIEPGSASCPNRCHRQVWSFVSPAKLPEASA